MVHPKTPPRWFAKLTSRTLGGAEHLDGKEGSPTRHGSNHSLKRMRVLWRTPPCYACHCIGPPCGFWPNFLSFGGIHRLGLLVTAMWGRAWCEKLRLDWVFFFYFPLLRLCNHWPLLLYEFWTRYFSPICTIVTCRMCVVSIWNLNILVLW